MPEMTIQLRCDPNTGQRDIIVKLHGDDELLPAEHEQLHRQLVNRLVEGGLIRAGEGSRLIVDREGQGSAAGPAAEASPERTSVGESS